MNYWITTQWPHSMEDDINLEHSGVFIPADRKAAVDIMECGDIVFIYESRYGRVLIEKLSDGSIKKTPCHSGQMRILNIVEVTSPVYKRNEVQPDKYTDGTSIWWLYHAKTKNLNSNGFISLSRLNEILGYKKNYNLRGFGDRHSGVKRITEKQARELIEEFNSNKK